LVITGDDEPDEIPVDNSEASQFIYLLPHNEKIRDVIDTVTSKAVLILAWFRQLYPRSVCSSLSVVSTATRKKP
jgi:hypothetical protein